MLGFGRKNKTNNNAHNNMGTVGGTGSLDAASVARTDDQMQRRAQAIAAANTAQALAESGVADLIKLIKDAPVVYIQAHHTSMGSNYRVVRIGDITFDTARYNVMFCEGLDRIPLLNIPPMQTDAVDRALDERMARPQSPLSEISPIAHAVHMIDLEYRKKFAAIPTGSDNAAQVKRLMAEKNSRTVALARDIMAQYTAHQK